MSWRARLGTALLVVAALTRPSFADPEYEVRWSATLEAALSQIASEEADDEVTGFFDRYRYTPNKSSVLPLELGVREAAFDLLDEGETPRLQFRLESPTSNLGISGPDVVNPFLNQRADLFGRLEGFDLDLAFRRIRSDRLRRFVDPGGPGQPFHDRTASDDRFFRVRTGLDGELRARPQELLEKPPAFVSWLAPRIAVRGSTQRRDGKRQVRTYLPSNQWLGLTLDPDQHVADLGESLLVAPGGLFTLVFDLDHERFRERDRAPLQSELGAPFPPSADPIGFVPDTDRTTMSVRLHSRLAQRAAISGGFQISRLEQVGSRTPAQRASGLRDNELRYTSAQVAADVALAAALSLNAFFKLDRRDNDIDRSTALFNDTGGSQVGPFLERFERMFAGAELAWRPRAANLLAVGARAERIDRDLDFVPFDSTAGPVFFPARLLMENAQISDRSESYTAYARAALRPTAGLGLRGELGYRRAPETGYILELDDYVYGKLRASYTVALERPLLLTAFCEGGSGENSDFTHTGGQGPNPTGAPLGRDFERWDYRLGVTASTSLRDDVSLFASLFHSRDAQDIDLVLSTRQRYLQDLAGIVPPFDFSKEGPIAYRADDFSLALGTRARLDERTDLGLSYRFTRAAVRYAGNGATAGASLSEAQRVDAGIHGVRIEAGHQLAEGLRVSAGYQLDVLVDHSPLRGTPGSTSPFDLDTFQHRITLGVTLTNALFE